MKVHTDIFMKVKCLVQGLGELRAELQAARAAAEALHAEAASAQEAVVKLAAADAAAAHLQEEVEALQPQLAAAQEVWDHALRSQ